MRWAATLALLAIFGCGGPDEPSDSEALRLRLTATPRDTELACRDIPGVDRIQLHAEDAAGAPLQPYPKTVDCDPQLTDLPEGTERLRVELFHGETRLYHGETRLSLPGPTELPIKLEADTAQLKLSWSFGEEGLSACEGRVKGLLLRVFQPDTVSVAKPVDCAKGGMWVDRILDPGPIRIELKAHDEDGATLYSALAKPVLIKGVNSYHLSLKPEGSSMAFDWLFVTDEGEKRACDDPGVKVQMLQIGVFMASFMDPVELPLDCKIARPFVLPSLRLVPGLPARVRLTAEGEKHLFVGEHRFGSEAQRERSIIRMVRTGDLQIQLKTEDPRCEALAYQLSAKGGSQEEQPDAVKFGEEAKLRLPYGDYRIEAKSTEGDCEGEISLQVDRRNTEATLKLGVKKD